MIDIHCHILPGVDDGAKTIEDSMKMAKEAVDEGIHKIIATPHHKNGQYENEKIVVLDKVAELNTRLKAEGIPLTILPSQEVRLFGEWMEEYEKGSILPLAEGSPYVMIEFPSSSIPRFADKLFYEMQLRGFIPVIVHPERNQEIVQNPDKLYHLVKNGALTQITAASLVGAFGKNVQKFSKSLIEANLTHFIASDAHNITNRNFKMREAFDYVEKNYGADWFFFFKENAELLVSGKNVQKDIPQRIKTKKFLGIF